MMKSLTSLLNALIRPFRMTAREAHANIAGLNIVFGAVLGFVLASTEAMDKRDFAMTLFYAATLVILILYVSHSKHRVIYALVCIGFVALLPTTLDEQFVTSTSQVPEKLQPTFIVWLAMTVMMEFWPRAADRAEG